jgi:hypothetical protein
MRNLMIDLIFLVSLMFLAHLAAWITYDWLHEDFGLLPLDPVVFLGSSFTLAAVAVFWIAAQSKKGKIV